jgi:Domain of unknown function (DUF3883)
MGLLDRLMAIGTKISKDWTEVENEAIVAEYLEMLRLQLAGEQFIKVHRIISLQKIVDRTRPSIEFKFRNISAALELLGLPWVKGYLPAHNFQRSLMLVLESRLEQFDVVTLGAIETPPSGMQEATALFYEQPPQKVVSTSLNAESEIVRMLRKFDAAERDQRNRNLGLKGEELIFHSERSRLAIENPKLVEKIRWVSKEDGDGAGFDILSFDKSGQERLLEVKTTVGGRTTPFYISRNELSLSRERPLEFRLIRLYDFAQDARAFELAPPLESFVSLEPQNYVARFQ